jgi:phospholipid/cholesterol/gamma-HCH transport system permease protein
MVSVPAQYRPLHLSGRLIDRASASFTRAGLAVTFCANALGLIPVALSRYRAQTVSTVTDLAWGRGAIVVGGGNALVMVLLGAGVGGTIAIAAIASLGMLGMAPLTGVVAAFVITREFAPLLAAAGFAVQAGCRMTAEIGAMRINEEIDAIEAMGLRSVAYVVSTRVVAGLITMVPTFIITLIASYTTCAAVVAFQGESPGAYRHYFAQFISGGDMLAAIAKVTLLIVAVILIHCYMGYFASGGPEGVGVASGRAVRASLVVIVVADMVLSIVFWGLTTPLEFKG